MAHMLSGLLGNEQRRRMLTHALQTDTLSHAYLLLGPEGVGRHTLAYELAAAVNCERRHERGQALPCRRCSACRRIFSGQYPDLHVLRPAEDRTLIGVDEVRALREDMFLSATEANVKVYLIERAETMTVQAQNALLKVLEEPPMRVLLFLLTSSLDGLLTTVKSRTVCIRMERLSDELLLRALKEKAEADGLHVSDSTYQTAIRHSEGVLGRALALIQPARAEAEERERERIVHLFSALSAKASYTALHATLSEFGTKRAELAEATDRMTEAVRDLLAIKMDEGAPLLFFILREKAEDLAKSFTVRALCGMADALTAAREKLDKNANMTLLLSELAQDMKRKL